MGAEDLATVNWDDAVLTFLPTLVLGVVVTNAPAIWSAVSQARRPPTAERLPAVAAVRVWREGLSPKFRSIEDFERRALLLALGGNSFSALCDLLVENDNHEIAAQRIGTLLASWIRDGLVVS
jgi:hypothetical protein